MAITVNAAQQGPLMEQTPVWLFTQGVLGFTTLVGGWVSWKLWNALQAAQKENALLQEKQGDRLLALHERTLTALAATNSQMDDNTKAIQLVLARLP